MRTSRLLAAAAALVIVAVLLITAAHYAEREETGAVHALAPQMFAQRNLGIALQRAAFRQDDLLPVYGGSDLNIRNRYHASALFRTYPTGFTIFPIGNAGSSSLIWLQALAAVGDDLHGEKVVISAPARLFADEAVGRHAYAANFSPLHASELAFSTDLSFAVKQEAARRMLQYPDTLANHPWLTFALEQLADGSLSGRLLYYASLPLGKLHTLVLRLQDHWETLMFVRAQVGLDTVRRQDANLDWASLLDQAERETRSKAAGNPFGFEKAFWAAREPEIARMKGMSTSSASAQEPPRSAEWIDFDLVLRVIKDLGGEPLILSRPLNGPFSDYLGVSLPARRASYERLREIAKLHDVAVVDFAERDADPFFTVDPASHLSSSGWVHYDRVLDAFFHGRQSGT